MFCDFLNDSTKMVNVACVFIIAAMTISTSHSNPCEIKCPEEGQMVCGFDELGKKYTMFVNKCAMDGFTMCTKFEYTETPVYYCVKSEIKKTRRMYGESCPVFCPHHYRPVCGASKIRDYKYRIFTNGCLLDMLNCRGDDDAGYVEVPLGYCPNHLMTNIFQDHVIAEHVDHNQDLF